MVCLNVVKLRNPVAIQEEKTLLWVLIERDLADQSHVWIYQKWMWCWYQKAFCLVYGLGPKRLLVLRRKLDSSGSGVSLEPDKQGKHDNHPSVGEKVKDLIGEHIRSYPAKHSHYWRSDNAGRLYLSPELSIKHLYQNFLQCHDPEYLQFEQENQQQRMRHKPTPKIRKPLVSWHMYHDIFIGEFSIHFDYPKSDTSGTCDGLKI